MPNADVQRIERTLLCALHGLKPWEKAMRSARQKGEAFSIQYSDWLDGSATAYLMGGSCLVVPHAAQTTITGMRTMLGISDEEMAALLAYAYGLLPPEDL